MHICMIDAHMSIYIYIYIHIYIYACMHMYTYEHLYNVLRLCVQCFAFVLHMNICTMVKDVFNPMLLLSGEVEVHLIFFC